MEKEIIEKIEALNDFIKKLTDAQIDASSTSFYEHAYVFNAYFYLVNNLKYDFESEKAIKAIKSPEEQSALYHKLLSLKKCILNDIGVCKQFSNYLCLLLANNKCVLASRGNLVANKLNCTVKMPSGALDKHELNMLTIGGKNYFCDLSMGATHSPAELRFMLATEQQIQDAYNTYGRSRLCGTGDKIEIKPGSIEEIYKLLETGRFVVNSETPQYKASKFTFK